MLVFAVSFSLMLNSYLGGSGQDGTLLKLTISMGLAFLTFALALFIVV